MMNGTRTFELSMAQRGKDERDTGRRKRERMGGEEEGKRFIQTIIPEMRSAQEGGGGLLLITHWCTFCCQALFVIVLLWDG